MKALRCPNCHARKIRHVPYIDGTLYTNCDGCGEVIEVRQGRRRILRVLNQTEINQFNAGTFRPIGRILICGT